MRLLLNFFFAVRIEMKSYRTLFLPLKTIVLIMVLLWMYGEVAGEPQDSTTVAKNMQELWEMPAPQKRFCLVSLSHLI